MPHTHVGLPVTLVTGSNGLIGRGLVAALTAARHPVVAASSTPSASGVRRCDLRDPTTFRAALHGVDTVFLYAEPDTIEPFLEQALAADVRHIVLLSSSSVLDDDAEQDSLARRHLDVERALTASPLTATFLRPAAFASNARQWAWQIRSTGRVRLPYPDARSAPIHERDVVAVARAVLVDRIGVGAAHTLTGPASLSFAEQLAVIGDHVGTAIPIDRIGVEDARAELEPHTGPAIAQALLRMWQRDSHRPADVTTAVADLTGRRSATFGKWVVDHIDEFRG